MNKRLKEGEYMKVRVHELAKKYDIKNKEFLEILKKDIGITVTSHLSNLDEDQVKKIDDYFAKMNMLKVETVEPVKVHKEKKEEKPIRKIMDEDENDEGEGYSQKNNKKAKFQQSKNKKNNNITFDEDGNSHKNKSKKKKGRRTDFVLKTVEATPDVVEEDGIKIIKFRGELTLGDFAEKLGVNSAEIIKKLFLKGQMLTINSPITLDMAEELAADYDVLVEEEQEVELDFGEKFDLEIEDKAADLKERPPVITIMGHVDHGKTSLLDAIRTTNVVGGEAGGITQKIGAYQVERDGKRITFIDTPGHEAFTDMRARGAQVTDIAILVVAADDGVMPQTVEAISHAKVAKVPIIVAVNKIDKPEANPMKVKQELMEHGLVSAEWGGDVEFVEVSAKQRINLDGLLDTILITAEILELKGNTKKRAKGVVLESRLDPKIGPIADILVQEGTLKIGDVIVAGEVQGKVKALLNDKGERVNTATVSQPIEVIGFNNVPDAGDTMYVIQNEQHAKRIVEEVRKERNLILRADSKGSVDALRDSLLKLSNDEVAVSIIQAASGAITESDIKLAEAAGAIIIGYNVRPTTKALKEAEASKVEIRTSGIIYHITEDIEKALAGMLEPEYREEYLGRIEIKKVFKVSKVGNVAGCIVIDGKVRNDSNIRILRDNVVIYEGKLASLKRFKDDAKEVVAGQECGLGVENFNDIKDGDVVEAFEMVEVKRTLK